MHLEAGLTLGPYELIEPLGAGGMGEVWRARDARLRRDVAVKFLAPALTGDRDAVSRFEREARAAAALSHPGIVTIHDVGVWEDRPYLVVELLRGRSLRQVLEKGPLATSRALDLARQTARALEAAHGAGIVHRDLKPENLFLTESGAVKILDFGLATVASPAEPDGAGAAASFRTGSGIGVGTLGYLAPERLRGEAAGPPADLFGLGCVLHECLTGAPLFRRASVAATLQALATETPPPLSAVLVGTSHRFAALVDRCLEKDPLRRPTAAELARELDATSVDEPTLLLAIGSSRSRAGRKVWMATGAAGAALLLGWGSARLWHQNAAAPAKESAPRMVAPASSAPAVLPEARGTNDEEAWKLFVRASYAWEKRGPALLDARDLFRQAVDRDPTFARAWLGLADTYAILHDYVALDTEETFPKARAAAERALAIDPSLAGAHTDLAYIAFYFDRDWALAESEFRAAIALAPGDPKAHQWFSELLSSRGRFDEALAEIREAQRLDALAPIMYAEEVWILFFAGRSAEAVARGERVSLDFADFAPLRAYRALALIEAGRAAEAARLLDDPRLESKSPVFALWLAFAEAKAGRPTAAAARLEAASRRSGESHLNAYYRSYALTALGRQQDALAALALAISRREEQVVWMKFDPCLAALRSQTRFTELLRSAGFDR